jgi:hypothetical protein
MVMDKRESQLFVHKICNKCQLSLSIPGLVLADCARYSKGDVVTVVEFFSASRSRQKVEYSAINKAKKNTK